MVTSNRLVEAAAENGFTMKEVSADKAYLSGENLLTTLRHKAIPYIPFKINSKAQNQLWPQVNALDSDAQFLQ